MFAVIEQKEPHAGRMAFEKIEQPATFAERHALAVRLRDELEVPLPIFVDGMDDASRALFSDLPSPAFVIDRDGRIADKLPWADAKELQAILARLLAVEVPDAAKRATLPLAARDAIARRLLAAGRADEALALLDAKADGDAATATAAIDLARALSTRAQCLRGAKDPERRAAVTAAQMAVTAAWRDDKGRMVAARIQLAEAADGLPEAAAAWRLASEALDARAPALTRKWLALAAKR